MGGWSSNCSVRSPISRAEDRTGELAAAAVQGIDSLEAYFAGYLPQLFSLPLSAGDPVWVIPVDPLAGAVLAVTVPLLIVFMILVGMGAQAKARSRWRALQLLSGHFLEVVTGLATLRAYRREEVQAQTIEAVPSATGAKRWPHCARVPVCVRARAVRDDRHRACRGDDRHSARRRPPRPRGGPDGAAARAELYGPLRAVGQQFHASTDGMAAAEQIFAVLDAPAALAPPRARAARIPDPALEPIRFDAVSFTYAGPPSRARARGVVVRDRARPVHRARWQSGAGKSTLAALLLRLADPTAGAISCGGVDLCALDPDDWRSQVAWVPQRTRVFSASIAENIALAAPHADRDRVRAAAEAAGLGELLGSLADGLDTRVGDGGRGLSAGQAQRIGVARAFARDAALLVLDEPTAHLDAGTAADITAALERLAVGRTMLLITHDGELAAHAERIVRLGAPLARQLEAVAA